MHECVRKIIEIWVRKKCDLNFVISEERATCAAWMSFVMTTKCNWCINREKDKKKKKMKNRVEKSSLPVKKLYGNPEIKIMYVTLTLTSSSKMVVTLSANGRQSMFWNCDGGQYHHNNRLLYIITIAISLSVRTMYDDYINIDTR